MFRVLLSLIGLIATVSAQCSTNNGCQACIDDSPHNCFWCYESNQCMTIGTDRSKCHDENCVSDRFDSSCDCRRCGSGSATCCPGTWTTSSGGGVCSPTPAPTTTAASRCHGHDSCDTCLANDACYWCHESGQCNYHGEQDTPCSGEGNTDYCTTQPGKYAKWACDCTSCGTGSLKCKRGAIAGIVIGSIAGVAVLTTVIVCYCRHQSRKYMAQRQQQQAAAYTLEQGQPRHGSVVYLASAPAVATAVPAAMPAAVPVAAPVSPVAATGLEPSGQRYGAALSVESVELVQK